MEAFRLYQAHNTLDLPEEELVQAAQQNPRNFEPLYQRYFRRIFLFVFHRVGEKSLAQDITSQVFLKALSNIRSFSFRGLPFSTWLYRIAINECNMHFRKKQTSHTIILDEEHFQLMAEEMSMDFGEHQAVLGKALQSLDHSELTLIELRFFEDLKFAEIAEVLGITENNAKVKLYRILEKLRKKMNLK